jgi:hypothetical protein
VLVAASTHLTSSSCKIILVLTSYQIQFVQFGIKTGVKEWLKKSATINRYNFWSLGLTASKYINKTKPVDDTLLTDVPRTVLIILREKSHQARLLSVSKKL